MSCTKLLSVFRLGRVPYRRRRKEVLATGKAKAGSRVLENSDLLIVYLHRLYYSIPYGQYIRTLEVPPENRFPPAHSPLASSAPLRNSMKVFTPYDSSNFENHEKREKCSTECNPLHSIQDNKEPLNSFKGGVRVIDIKK